MRAADYRVRQTVATGGKPAGCIGRSGSRSLAGIPWMICLCWLLAAGAAQAAPPSHCADDEKVVFNCRVGSTKTVSICSSKETTSESGYFQYRFGRLGKPELVYPESRGRVAQYFRVGHLIYSGGGGVYVTFRIGPVKYVVFSRTYNHGKSNDKGVVVEQENKEPTVIWCKDPAVSKLEPHWLEKLGLPEDEPGFDVPYEKRSSRRR